MGEKASNWMLGTVLMLVGILFALGLAFHALAEVIGGIVAFIGAATIFHLQRNNELGDEETHRHQLRRRAYALVTARLSQYRETVSFINDYFGQALQLGAGVDGLARRLGDLAWPDYLNLDWEHARHIDAEDIISIETFRVSVNHNNRQIMIATEDGRQAGRLPGFCAGRTQDTVARADEIIADFLEKEALPPLVAHRRKRQMRGANPAE